MAQVLRIHPNDTVIVALTPLAAGTVLSDWQLTLATDVPQGHKIALKAHAAGDPVIKYGNSIGYATEAIAPGSHVHSHNLKTALGGPLEYAFSGPMQPEQPASVTAIPQIMAYERANGDIGIRNDIWIIPLVGCVNGIARNVANRVSARRPLPADMRVLVLEHPYGCSQLGDDMDTTRAILQNLAMHPNAGGVVAFGLGCENNTLEEFRAGVQGDPSRIRYLIAQEVSDETSALEKVLDELIDQALKDVRTPVAATRLRVGLKCGGSDGFSGITANPLLGAFSDWFCALGGTSVLTEVPEMFGAEHLLMQRSENRDVFERTVSLINDFKQYFLDHEQPVYENPSPGNKKGGITTLEEKSLGCVQKAGHAVVRDVRRYTERIRTNGLSLLEGPGNDIVAVTALASAGCHLTLFTTGRGTPLGSPVPTLKIATNSDLAERKAGWIDFNAGPLAEGKVSMETLRDQLAQHIFAVAEGKLAKHEEKGIFDIALFKDGITL